MKKFVTLVMLTCILSGISYGQIKNPLKLGGKKGEKRVNKNVDKSIDKGYDKVEDLFKKNKDKDQQQGEPKPAEISEDTGQAASGTKTGADKTATLNWAKYDFVPGDNIIFEDNQETEENGEFPSRWDLVEGVVEIANFGGDNVIMFRGGAPMIVPYLKNSNNDYLPEVFTVELDLYLNDGSFNIYLYDRKNQKRSTSSSDNIEIWSTSMSLYPSESKIPNNGSIKDKWAHIAIAYTNGKIKGYIDDTRLINIPHLDFNPSGISLYAYHAKDENRYYVKNVRIAEGGVKYYDRFLQNGKIVTNGICFDVNKSTIKPESMGVINSIYQLLQEHPDLKFSVEGHTDSDGDADFNQKLSEDRAEAVKNKLIEMGISSERLTSKGYGETTPVADNSTPEGKAENRRVEFVKM